MLIYRPGAVTAEMISAVAGAVTMFQADPVELSKPPESLPSPGAGLRHYAPRAKLELVDVRFACDMAYALSPAIERYDQTRESIGLMLPDGWDASYARYVFPWGPWGNNEVLAQRLFAGLRMLDEAGATVIICPLPGADGVGLALRDRLQKAARKK
jgi:L-threonylcarbamoyladenylate synthase